MFNIRQTALFNMVVAILKDGFVSPNDDIDPNQTLEDLGLTPEQIAAFPGRVQQELINIIVCYENSHYKLQDFVFYLDDLIFGSHPN